MILLGLHSQWPRLRVILAADLHNLTAFTAFYFGNKIELLTVAPNNKWNKVPGPLSNKNREMNKSG